MQPINSTSIQQHTYLQLNGAFQLTLQRIAKTAEAVAIWKLLSLLQTDVRFFFIRTT